MPLGRVYVPPSTTVGLSPPPLHQPQKFSSQNGFRNIEIKIEKVPVASTAPPVSSIRREYQPCMQALSYFF